MRDKVDGLLVKKGNVDDLVQAITYLLKNSKRAQKIGAAGRASLNKSYTMENFARNIYNYLNKDYTRQSVVTN